MPPLEFGEAAKLALLVPLNLHPATVVAETAADAAPVGGPAPTPALLSATRSVTLQDIFINGHEGSCRHTCPLQSLYKGPWQLALLMAPVSRTAKRF